MRASLAFLLCLCAPLTARADFWTITDLGRFPGGVPVAEGVNDLGWVVGSSWQTPGGPARAFLWRDGVMQDLGAPPGHSFAYAVNNHGQVVGTSASGMFLWEGGVFRTLPPPRGRQRRRPEGDLPERPRRWRVVDSRQRLSRRAVAGWHSNRPGHLGRTTQRRGRRQLAGPGGGSGRHGRVRPAPRLPVGERRDAQPGHARRV